MKTAYRLDFGTVSAMSTLSLCLATPYLTKTVVFSDVVFELVAVRLDSHLPEIGIHRLQFRCHDARAVTLPDHSFFITVQWPGQPCQLCSRYH